MMNKPLLILPFLFVGCATQQSPLESRFKAADANRDGLVSRAEATNMMIAEVFEVYDANGDGFVDEQEFVAGGGDRAKFAALTKSTGGKVSLGEAQANPKIVETMAVSFDEADADGNGSISLPEVKAYVAKVEAVVR